MELRENTDIELIQEIAAGSQAAFEEFHQRHAKLVRRTLENNFRLKDEAADVAQDVFVQIWRRAASFDAGRGNVRAWLLIITRTRALDYLRAKEPLETLDEGLGAEPPAGSAAVIRWEEIKLRQEMNRLPEHLQAILRMAYFEGYSHSQIAEMWNKPLGTVKTQIRTGLLQLRNRLEAQPGAMPAAA